MKQLILLLFLALAVASCKKCEICEVRSSLLGYNDWTQLDEFCEDDLDVLKNYKSINYELLFNSNGSYVEPYTLETVTGIQGIDYLNYVGNLELRCTN